MKKAKLGRELLFTNKEEEELKSNIRASMSFWYPNVPYQQVDLAEVREYWWSRHFVFRLTTSGDQASTKVLVKVLRPADAHYPPQDVTRPSHGGLEFEYSALALIHQHFGGGQVEGVTAVRPLAVFPDIKALVMEYLPGQNFQSIISSAAKPWATARAIKAATMGSYKAGRLLAALHSIPHDPFPKVQRCNLNDHQAKLSQNLRQSTAMVGSKRSKELLYTLHTSRLTFCDNNNYTTTWCYLHRDFYPDNLILLPDGRVYTIDTTLDQVGPVEEDIAKFLVGTETIKGRILFGSITVSVEMLNLVKSTFLDGYNSLSSYSPKILNLFRLQAIVRRWHEVIGVLESEAPVPFAYLLKRYRIEPMLLAYLIKTLEDYLGRPTLE